MNKILSFNKPKEVPMGTMYDMNKEIMNTKEKSNQEYKIKPLSHLELSACQSKLEDWFNMEVDCYAMLLCHDRRDYTIFHMYENQNPNPPAIAAAECIGCLTDRGEVLAIDPTPDKAWEIWLRIGDDAFCYYLFRYDEAVIEC